MQDVLVQQTVAEAVMDRQEEAAHKVSISDNQMDVAITVQVVAHLTAGAREHRQQHAAVLAVVMALAVVALVVAVPAASAVVLVPVVVAVVLVPVVVGILVVAAVDNYR